MALRYLVGMTTGSVCPPPRDEVSGLDPSPHEWGFDAGKNRIHPVTALAVRFISLRATTHIHLCPTK